MFMAVLFTIAKGWTQPKSRPVDDKQNVANIYNGLLFSLKKEILTHAPRMNLEDIIIR
jgi:hypothetical protein